MPDQRLNHDPKLIFDFGMHHGTDTMFYLQKGFRVVGVEANPDLVAFGREKFAEHIESGQLTIVDKALWHRSNETVEFFLSDNDIWSSLAQSEAEKLKATSHEITVSTITLADMLEEFGTPYYMKCDMEGGDGILVDQIAATAQRSPFVSVEVSFNAAELMARMFCAGYDRMQIVNQAMHHQRDIPNPSFEGEFAPLPGGMISGVFGRDLPADRWADLPNSMITVALFHQLWPRMHIGWIDVHFTTAGMLG